MNWVTQIGRAIARKPFIRQAIEERADLSAFMKPPTLSIIVGVSAICISFLTCWPAIGALGVFAFHCGKPLLLVIGGPLLYGFSHLLFLAGMGLTGTKYSLIFLRWLARIGFERFATTTPASSGCSPAGE